MCLASAAAAEKLVEIQPGERLEIENQGDETLVLAPEYFGSSLALDDPDSVFSRAAARRMHNKPQRALEEASELIYGYGTKGRLDEAGIAACVGLTRARIRGREMARLLKADLDADLIVTAGELAVLQSISTSCVRGRLELAFRAADSDQDGALAFVELHSHVQTIAPREVSQRDAADPFGIVSFDRNGDGAVTLDEVADGIDATAPRI